MSEIDQNKGNMDFKEKKDARTKSRLTYVGQVYNRESAYGAGLVALNLKELKSRSGRPFVEYERTTSTFRKARVMSEDGKFPEQFAYFCPPVTGNSGCGWVLGNPRYDKNGHYCFICGAKIGERKKSGR